MSAPELPGSSRALYRALLTQAAGAGAALLVEVLARACQSMRDDALHMRGLQGRDQLALGIKLLDQYIPRLCAAYPKALEKAFQRHALPDSKLGALATQDLQLDQLELMSESQVQERVEMVRALQHVLLVTEFPLAEFNAYMSGLQGHDCVMAERNPLRPLAYLGALQSLTSELTVPPWVCAAWMQHVSGAFGQVLSSAYAQWSAQLKSQGVRPASLQSARMSGALSSRPNMHEPRRERAVWSPQHRQTVLTLDRLRRLIAGEFEPPPTNNKEAFARQFAREFESGYRTETKSAELRYDATMPAAFEALQEMQQVDQVARRIEQRPLSAALPLDPELGAPSVRDQLMSQAQAMNHRLSLEVVALMVDNLINDTRLLAPIRLIIERLEPALLRLVLVDPRFFIDKQHPARHLLQEISQRGLAFGSVDDAQFNLFLVSLQRYVSPLTDAQIDSAEPFERALNSLLGAWTKTAVTDGPRPIDSAMAALEYAEERNLLADKLVAGMQSITKMRQVPQSVVEFLCGPWAQVMASARLTDGTGMDDPGGYKALVKALLWSAQPELTRKNVGKLTKLVPRLLPKLREGLRLIDFPSVRTSAFFDVLMKLHQQAFRSEDALPAALAPVEVDLPDQNDPWVAPAEAKASGFMALPDDLNVGVPNTAASVSGSAQTPVTAAPPTAIELEQVTDALSLGAWVELQVQGVWTRTQLSWISPQHTMYLFTTVQGKTLSMTKRMLERLLNVGSLKVLSERSMVDGALDAVVQTAMLNSLDLRVG